ncbi:MAG: NADH-quinone oxidoreductase subunit J [Acidimicrobiales bacterium]
MSALLAQTTYTYLPEQVGFWMIAILMVVAALRVVTTKNVVHAALWLVVVLAGVAAQFILLASEFVAVTQVLVYIGAIVVLLLFGVMLTKAPLGRSDGLDGPKVQKGVAVVIALALLGMMGWVLAESWRDTKLDLHGRTVGELGFRPPASCRTPSSRPTCCPSRRCRSCCSPP